MDYHVTGEIYKIILHFCNKITFVGCVRLSVIKKKIT